MADSILTGNLSSTNEDFKGEMPGAIHYGIQGPPGPAGPSGNVSFEDLTEEQRESLRGPKGDDGKTAYEYAKDGGYTGSEDEFKTKLANEYATQGYVNQQVKKAAPRNLLDNSDFRNPVNQRGQDSYTGHCYCIDRWQVNSATTLTVMDGFCRLSGFYNLWQIVPVTLKAGKTYTCAARIKASEGVRDGWLLVEASVDGTRLAGWSKKISDWTIAIVNFTPDSDLEAAAIQFTNSGDVSVATDIEWIALYEGEYTAETLPEYQPKGFGAELLECMRYYQILRPQEFLYNTIADGYYSLLVTFAVPMRIIPTMVDYTGNNVEGCQSVTTTSARFYATTKNNNYVETVILSADL